MQPTAAAEATATFEGFRCICAASEGFNSRTERRTDQVSEYLCLFICSILVFYVQAFLLMFMANCAFRLCGQWDALIFVDMIVAYID